MVFAVAATHATCFLDGPVECCSASTPVTINFQCSYFGGTVTIYNHAPGYVQGAIIIYYNSDAAWRFTRPEERQCTVSGYMTNPCTGYGQVPWSKSWPVTVEVPDTYREKC